MTQSSTLIAKRNLYLMLL